MGKGFFLKRKIDDWVSVLGWDVGVDLGSSNALIFLKDRGVVIDEPMMMARIKKKRWTGLSAPKVKYGEPIAYGFKAKEMLNREPKRIEVVQPIRKGIIVDLEAAEQLISYYLKLVYEVPGRYPKILKPRVVVGVPSGVTDVQKRAVKSIFKASGARRVMLVEQAVLAAVGLGLPMDRSAGLVIVDVGGGKTEVSVVSMGGVVLGKSVGVGGNDFDQAIINYVKMKHGMLIGCLSAERVKIEVGSLGGEGKKKKPFLVRGRDLETGLPRSINLVEDEVSEAILMLANKIVSTVSWVLDETAPELMEDVLKRGIIMVGRGSKLSGLAGLIEKEIKVNARVVDDCGLCVVKGAGELINNKALLKTVNLVSGYDS